MKIDILCPSGSPIGLIPDDIYGRGVGGAELALMSFARVMARRHDVTIYNDPVTPGRYDNVQYRKLNEWNHADERDVAILFRAPHYTMSAAKGRRIFWSCDQYTTGDFRTDVFPFVDEIVCISEFHKEHFIKTYKVSPDKISVIGLGVLLDEYRIAEGNQKVKNQFIYCSVPGRGLEQLAHMWPRIKSRMPDATLVITSDYRLWGLETAQNHEYRLMFMGQPDVQFLGKVSRAELVQLQLHSDMQLHPCTYDELFCIAVAECSVAGAVPLTSSVGALATTNQFGMQIAGNPKDPRWQTTYVDNLEMLCVKRRDLLEQYRAECLTRAPIVYDWETLTLVWEALFHG